MELTSRGPSLTKGLWLIFGELTKSSTRVNNRLIQLTAEKPYALHKVVFVSALALGAQEGYNQEKL